jgi:hypothetical protein
VPPSEPPSPPPDQPPAPPPVVAPPLVAPQPPPPEPPSPRAQEALANYEPSSVQLGGYLQALYRAREDSVAQDDTNGFKLVRVRLTALGQTRAGNLELSAYIESELQPGFELDDAYASVSRAFGEQGKQGRLTLDGGQMRVPISRQNLISDSRLAFVEKAQLASIAPDRDLGIKATLALPRPNPLAPEIRVIGGAFDGEGKNQVENRNQDYLYTGRVELTPFGHEPQLAESSFGGRFVTLAFSIGRNKRTESSRLDKQTYLGFDVAGSFHGLSGSYEYLQVKHELTGDPMLASFKANGFVAQLNYLLPIKLPPLHQARLELGARLEEIDRNDTVPISQPGDAAQSARAITAVASYYLRMHTIKAQLEFTHFTEIEDKTAVGENAVIDNDQVLLQVTYRLE